ncbi:MAG: Mechanosensitive channel MscK precursor [Pseudomonadota bacterium]|jgi:small-conductance mechanosensitive channel
MHPRQACVAGAVLLATLAAVPAVAQDAPDLEQVVKFIRWGGVFLSVFVVVGASVVLRLVGGLASGLSRRFSSHRLLVHKLNSIAQFVIYVLASSVVLGLSVRLDSTALTVIGGGLAFSVGFAMRDLVAAFIAGITIMFDRPFQVGDRVSYGGEYGDIIKIGLRSVRMNTLDDNVVTIPNNKVLTDVTSCGNYGALEMQVAMDFYIGVDQNIELACSLIQEVCLTSRFCFLARPVPVLVKQVVVRDCIAFQIKARPYVLDVKHEKAFETDVHIRVQRAFLERDVQPPALLHRQLPAR